MCINLHPQAVHYIWYLNDIGESTKQQLCFCARWRYSDISKRYLYSIILNEKSNGSGIHRITISSFRQFNCTEIHTRSKSESPIISSWIASIILSCENEKWGRDFSTGMKLCTDETNLAGKSRPPFRGCCPNASFYKQSLFKIRAWVRITSSLLWGMITCPFPSFNGGWNPPFR